MNNKEYKELNKKLEELNNENEIIKINSIKEQQLIASSMLELAIQYFNFKNEMNDKNKKDNENNGLSWIEIERRKNFPCDYG